MIEYLRGKAIEIKCLAVCEPLPLAPQLLVYLSEDSNRQLRRVVTVFGSWWNAAEVPLELKRGSFAQPEILPLKPRQAATQPPQASTHRFPRPSKQGNQVAPVAGHW